MNRSKSEQVVAGTRQWLRTQQIKLQLLLNAWLGRGRAVMLNCKGQGTTEYAILVGVLVVIAIIAVVTFKDKLQELWEAIADGINGL